MVPFRIISHMFMWICLSIFLEASITFCFNMDTGSPVFHRGDEGTFFGYSVAMHRIEMDDMLVVGAPRDHSGPTSSQKTGAVYICPVTPFANPGGCRKITKELEEDKRNKTNQWLGASVRSSGPDGTVLTCAPLSKEIRYVSSVEPSGKCILFTNNFTQSDDVVPCQPTYNDAKGHIDIVQCVAGIDADINEDSYIVGGPNGFQGQGAILKSVHDAETFIHTNSQRPYDEYDGNYQGYSVAYGNFSGNRQQLDIVTGAPRANTVLLGQVRIYNGTLHLLKTITGFQAASYFGHSLAVSDLNADGLDDLIVGAPSYWNREGHHIDAGQIYVYYQNGLSMFEETPQTVITGYVERGRFGFVVAAMGDINDDGANDLAVSAPYDGDGAVYIYNGRQRETIKTTPVQILRPRDFKVSPPMVRFGFSMTGNRDADHNEYPDLVVGSYKSDSVILIRTKPVIRPVLTVSFDFDGVNLTSRTLPWKGKLVSGFNGTTCFHSYSGLGTNNSYEFNITVTMDADQKTPRAWFYDETGVRPFLNYKVVIRKSDREPHCFRFSAFLKEQIIDKTSPIVVRVSTDVVQDLETLPAGEIPHVLDVDSKEEDAQIPIKVDCLTDRCDADLVLSAKSDKSILYFGETTVVVLTVTVDNVADEAFGALLYVIVPDVFQYSSYNAIKTDLSILCENRLQSSGVVCDIGNPLPRNTRIVFELQFDVVRVPGDREDLTIHLSANSSTVEDTEKQMDNNRDITFYLQPKVGVILQGSADIERVIFNDTKVRPASYYKAADLGNRIVHTYWVQNPGPAEISSATLHISWPMKTKDGNYLLYLTNVVLSNGETCETGGNVNPDNLEISNNSTETAAQVSKTEKLQSDGGRRRRRMVDDTTGSQSSEQQSVDIVADCSEGYEGCVNITCTLRNLPNDASNVILTIESRLYEDTLIQGDADPLSWKIVSSARLTVNSIPYITQPSKTPEEMKKLSLYAIPLTTTERKAIPLWAIILSICLGLLMLVVIISVLWKCGFFMRKTRATLEIQHASLVNASAPQDEQGGSEM